MEIVEATSSRSLVSSSLAIDLYWALRGASSAALRDRHEELAAAYAAEPALAERVVSYWEDGDTGFGELVVLAQRGAVLTSTDPAQVLEGFALAGARAPGAPDLLSEETANRDRILHRLGQLAASPTRRREYLGLLAEVMTKVVTESPNPVIARSERAAEAMRAERSGGNEWTALIDREFVRAATTLQSRAESAGTFSTVIVIPSAYSGRVLLFEVDGVVIVGVAAQGAGVANRKEIDEVAHLLKAVSDATRLSILDLLGFRPATVGEISIRLDLAQPTVSNHVKVLREAGFVRSQRNGARRDLTVDRTNYAHLLGRLEQLLNKDSAEAVN